MLAYRWHVSSRTYRRVLVKFSPRLGGEIGRRAGLKIRFRKECRFDSDPRHHLQKTKQL
jgi:hypothetical protein